MSAEVPTIGEERIAECGRWNNLVLVRTLAIIDTARRVGLPPDVSARLGRELATESEIEIALNEYRARPVVPPEILAREAQVDELLRARGADQCEVGVTA